MFEVADNLTADFAGKKSHCIDEELHNSAAEDDKKTVELHGWRKKSFLSCN